MDKTLNIFQTLLHNITDGQENNVQYFISLRATENLKTSPFTDNKCAQRSLNISLIRKKTN